MSTTVKKMVECDRCKLLASAPVVSAMPRGWAQVYTQGPEQTRHLCEPCANRAFSVWQS